MQLTNAQAVAILAFVSSAAAYRPSYGYEDSLYARSFGDEADMDIYVRDADYEDYLYSREAADDDFDLGLYAREAEADAEASYDDELDFGLSARDAYVRGYLAARAEAPKQDTSANAAKGTWVAADDAAGVAKQVKAEAAVDKAATAKLAADQANIKKETNFINGADRLLKADQSQTQSAQIKQQEQQLAEIKKTEGAQLAGNKADAKKEQDAQTLARQREGKAQTAQQILNLPPPKIRRRHAPEYYFEELWY